MIVLPMLQVSLPAMQTLLRVPNEAERRALQYGADLLAVWVAAYAGTTAPRGQAADAALRAGRDPSILTPAL